MEKERGRLGTNEGDALHQFLAQKTPECVCINSLLWCKLVTQDTLGKRRGHSAPFGATFKVMPIHQTPDTSVCALECARIPAHQYSDAPITLHCCWCIGVCIGAILCWCKLVTQDTLGAKKALLPLPMLKLCTTIMFATPQVIQYNTVYLTTSISIGG